MTRWQALQLFLCWEVVGALLVIHSNTDWSWLGIIGPVWLFWQYMLWTALGVVMVKAGH